MGAARRRGVGRLPRGVEGVVAQCAADEAHAQRQTVAVAGLQAAGPGGRGESVAVGIGGIASFFSGYGRDQEFGNLITESGANLVQEDGGFIIV